MPTAKRKPRPKPPIDLDACRHTCMHLNDELPPCSARGYCVCACGYIRPWGAPEGQRRVAWLNEAWKAN